MIHSDERGVDFSFARPPAARLVELGYRFVVGYISVPPASPGKNITREQCDEYLAAGLGVLLVWEMTAIRANGGPAFGSQDGQDAKRLAANLGYPINIPILVADDTNTTPSNVTAQEAYLWAFANSCLPYPVGIYGDADILERTTGLWDIGWLPNAWSWSGRSRDEANAKAVAIGAHVLQGAGFWIDDLWAVDPNLAIRDFPAWTRQPPEEGDMAAQWVLKAGTNEVWEVVHEAGYTWTFHVGSANDPGARNELLSGLFYDPAGLKEWPADVLDGAPHQPRITVRLDVAPHIHRGTNTGDVIS